MVVCEDEVLLAVYNVRFMELGEMPLHSSSCGSQFIGLSNFNKLE